MGRSAVSALRLHEALKRKPVVSVPELAETLDLSRPTITSALGRIAELGIVQEVTGKRPDRLFVYAEYFDTLNDATDPLGA